MSIPRVLVEIADIASLTNLFGCSTALGWASRHRFCSGVGRLGDLRCPMPGPRIALVKPVRVFMPGCCRDLRPQPARLRLRARVNLPAAAVQQMRVRGSGLPGHESSTGSQPAGHRGRWHDHARVGGVGGGRGRDWSQISSRRPKAAAFVGLKAGDRMCLSKTEGAQCRHAYVVIAESTLTLFPSVRPHGSMTMILTGTLSSCSQCSGVLHVAC
jgi:hypothetical protein